MANDEIYMEVIGLDDLAEMFLDVPDEIKKKAIEKWMNDTSKDVLNRAKQLVPSYTGRLRESLKVRKVKTRSSNFFKRSVYVPAGKNREDKSGAYYARFVEFGTENTTPRSFLKRSVSDISPYAIGLVKSSIQSSIEKAVKRYNKKNKKKIIIK